MLSFLLVASALWSLLHVYVARRVVGPLAVQGFWRRALYLLFVPGILLAPTVFAADSVLEPDAAYVFRWIAWTYIGAFSTFFALIVTRDLVLGSSRLLMRVRARSTPPPEVSSPERRRFLLNASSGALGTATLALSAYGLREARRLPDVVKVEVPIKGLPRELDGYHIVQLSDMHVGHTIDKDFVLPIIEAVTSLAPDLLALTGDLVDGTVEQLREHVSPLAYLRARDGVLCVTGNHEYYSGVDAWCAHFRELGMTVLNNQHVLVQRGGARLLVAGVTDVREGKKFEGHTSDPARALVGAPGHDVRILLAHQPRSAAAATQHGFALQLSGHTHGGQFFPWNLLVGLVQPVSQGLARIGEMWVYVNRGTCYWGPPNRSFVPPEITSLRLRRV
ncbi:MAG TPA: metallophosphoesterase [Polyangiales bacterium]